MSEEEIVRGICSGSHHRHGALRAWVTGPLGARMQRFFISHGVAQPSNRVEGKASPRPVHLDDEQWRAVEETVAGPTHAQEVDSVDECVSRGIEAFSAQMPERGWALAMQMDGASVSEIAAQLGRTVAAAKEYLSQCRRHLQPFIANCRELLSP
jgi:hypothetical protein